MGLPSHLRFFTSGSDGRCGALSDQCFVVPRSEFRVSSSPGREMGLVVANNSTGDSQMAPKPTADLRKDKRYFMAVRSRRLAKLDADKQRWNWKNLLRDCQSCDSLDEFSQML